MSKRETKSQILLVEDEESIREGLCDVLAFHGYAPTAVADGEQGLTTGSGQLFDLAILDVMLPGMSGLDVCQELRQQQPRLPILMLTAKGSEDDIVQGLRRGADDYVTKPFSIRELMARVEALLRRSGKLADPEDELTFGPWRVDPSGLQATAGDKTIDLTQREVDLMRLLVRESGRIVSRRTLLQEVWGWVNPDELQTRTVDMHIAKLRKKVDVNQSSSLIETVRGAGYRGKV